jgi:hypothetical protein
VLSPEYAVYTLFTHPAALPGGPLMSWLRLWAWSPGWVGIVLLMSLFPTGRLLSQRWAWPIAIELVAVLAWIVILGGATWAYRGPALFATDPPPEMQSAAALLDQFVPLLFLAMVLGLLASIVGAVVRFRRSRGVERQQMKWFVVALVCTALAASAAFAFDNLVPLADAWATPVYLLEILAFGSGPLAICIAVLRYRLYDIDIIARRALVYATLTATLALLYIGSVVLLQQLFRAVSGQASDLAIIASTLAIAGLFSSLRQRIQALIDRRFYRAKYDAAQTLATLSVRLRDETDLDRLTGDILAVVEEAIQPAHMSLWLRTRPGEPARRD